MGKYANANLISILICKSQRQFLFLLHSLVLKACAHSPVMWSNSLSKGNDHPIAIANRIFTTLQKKNDFNATPTHSTYSFMFRVYKRHMDFADPRYAPLMLTLWKRCCQDGQVSKFSLEAFRESVPESQFFMAIGGRDMMKTNAANIMVDDLPREWRRNVGPEWKPRHLNEKTNRH